MKSSHTEGRLGKNHLDYPITNREAELYSCVTPGPLLHQAGPTSVSRNLDSPALKC